jgi:hypothetical protein
VDREGLVEKIALANVQVADDELFIAQQKQRISVLMRDGHSTIGAEECLHALEIAHALDVAGRDWLKQELATTKPEWEYLPRWPAAPR